MKNQGTLYMIPITLGDTAVNKVIPELNNELINEIDVYVVENIKTARRFLKKAGIKKEISELTFFELNKRTQLTDLPTFLKPITQGKNVGVLSGTRSTLLPLFSNSLNHAVRSNICSWAIGSAG